MRDNTTTARATRARVLAAAAVLATGAGLAVLATGPAFATTCGTGLNLTCDVGGSAHLSAGTLKMNGPATLKWGATLTGSDLQLVDDGSSNGASASDLLLTTDDATGSNAGWHITASATTFTDGTSDTLPDAGAMAFTGSTGAESDATRPSAACDTGATCTVPTDTTITYPVPMDTAPTDPYTVYSADASTGEGQAVIGGSTSVGWWVNVPANTTAGTYTSVITVAIVTGPVG